MPRFGIKSKSYNTTRKLAAARKAVGRARALLRGRTMAPPRTGGFWGVRQRIGSRELKSVDVDVATYVADTTGTVTLLNGVAAGTDFTDRIGRKIVMKSLYVSGILKNVDSISGPALCRLLIVYDNQANGAAPVITDVIKTINGVAMINLNNRDRFRIVYDKKYALGGLDNTATQAYSTGSGQFHIKLFRKLNLETLFSGTTAAIGSFATGSLYMLTCSDQAAGAGGIFKLCTRVRFIDG